MEDENVYFQKLHDHFGLDSPSRSYCRLEFNAAHTTRGRERQVEYRDHTTRGTTSRVDTPRANCETWHVSVRKSSGLNIFFRATP